MGNSAVDMSISLGTPEATSDGLFVESLTRKLKSPGSNLLDWVTADYLERLPDPLSREFTLDQYAVGRTMSPREATRLLATEGPPSSRMREILHVRAGIAELAKHDGCGVIITRNDSYNPPPPFRIHYIEPLNNNQHRMAFLYIPEPTGCDEIAFYTDRDQNRPIVKKDKNYYRILFATPEELGASVVTYYDRDNNGDTKKLITGMDYYGAITLKQKAAYFGLRISSGLMPRSSLISYPLELFFDYLKDDYHVSGTALSDKIIF